METIYDIVVNNTPIGAFEYWEGEKLWQALSEEIGLIRIDEGDEKHLSEWQDLPTDNIHLLLTVTKEARFILSWEMVG